MSLATTQFIDRNLNSLAAPIGATGGITIGLSFSVVHDTRDDIDAPYVGHLIMREKHFKLNRVQYDT